MEFFVCFLVSSLLATTYAQNDYIPPPPQVAASSQSNSFVGFGGAGNNRVAGPVVSHVKRGDGTTLVEIMGEGVEAGQFNNNGQSVQGLQGNEIDGNYGPSNGANGAGNGGSYDPLLNPWGPPAKYEYTVHHGASQRGFGGFAGAVSGPFSGNSIDATQYSGSVEGGYLLRRNF